MNWRPTVALNDGLYIEVNMLRYLMKHTFRDKYSGCEGVDFYTIDGDADQVEHSLKSGGRDEGSYERHELIGVEILDV
jgi:hypothetical protein